MGCSSACKIFETFSTAIQWMAHHKQGVQHMTHMLDDFFMVSPTVSQCQNYLLKFLDMCSDINVPMAPEKTTGPATVIILWDMRLIRFCLKFVFHKISWRNAQRQFHPCWKAEKPRYANYSRSLAFSVLPVQLWCQEELF